MRRNKGNDMSNKFIKGKIETDEEELFDGLATLADNNNTLERVNATKAVEDFEALTDSALEIDSDCWGTRLA